tara:strand:+ start:354 stop:1490 length:1137 start_codon:yes stop_codon:yes gene_type:complete
MGPGVGFTGDVKWTLSGAGITDDDFASYNTAFNTALSGFRTGTIGRNEFDLTFTLKKDFKTEGNEIIEIKLFDWFDRPLDTNAYITINDTSKSPEEQGTNGKDIFLSTSLNNSIDGKSDIDRVIYSGNFKDYSFNRGYTGGYDGWTSITGDAYLTVTDLRSGINNGIDTLQNIEYLQFADQIVEESKVDIIKVYSGNFSDYKFYKKSNGSYQIKTSSGYDDITGLPLLTFTGEATSSSFHDISAIVDIKGTFDQVTGLNTDSGKMFRLYNAAFKRLPDSVGLKYWIDKFSSGENDERSVASSFLVSEEFKQRYGDNVSNAKYVETLYVNVLGRNYDQEGYNYWVGNLNAGTETRYELLLGFAESAENKFLFTEMTGFA